MRLRVFVIAFGSQNGGPRRRSFAQGLLPIRAASATDYMCDCVLDTNSQCHNNVRAGHSDASVPISWPRH